MSEPATRFRVGPREGGKRLDRFLHERIPGLSRTRIQDAIRRRVTLSWSATVRPATPVRPGGEVHVGYTPLPETLLELDIPVLATGDGWLAVDKPAGVPVHPVNTVRENSLIRMLRRQEGDADLRLVHRLDRETTGVLLVARDHAAASRLSRGFLRGEVEKEYLAVVRGRVEHPRGTVDLPLGDAPESAVYTKRGVGGDQRAVTHWVREGVRGHETLLRVRLETGRRHQIRVHLDAIGHPIAGDILYGRPEDDYLRLVRGEGDARAEGSGPRRQLLHCRRLAFPDPHRVEVRAPIPSDFGTWGRV